MVGGISNYNPNNGFHVSNSYSSNNDNTSTNNLNSPNAVGDKDMQVKPGRKSSPAECQTCKERKYQDGSNENVSFKSPTHISPNAAAGAVRAHEGEHVANAYSKAAKDNGKVIRASVSIHTAICPECGITYVSGGTTNTTIKYSKEESPIGNLLDVSV